MCVSSMCMLIKELDHSKHLHFLNRFSKWIFDTHDFPHKVVLCATHSIGARDYCIFYKRVPRLSLYFLPGHWHPFCKFWCWHFIDPTRKYQWKVSDNYKGSYFFFKRSLNHLLTEMSRGCHYPVMTPEITITSLHFLTSLSLTLNIQVHEMH